MIFYFLKELYLFTVTAQIFIWLSYLTTITFQFYNSKLAFEFFPFVLGLQR